MQLKLKIIIEHIGKKLSTDEHNFQPNGQTLTWPKNNKIRKRFPLNKPFSQSNGPDLPYVVVSIITVPSPTHQLPLQILSSFVFGYSGSHHCSSGCRLPSNPIKDKPLTKPLRSFFRERKFAGVSSKLHLFSLIIRYLIPLSRSLYHPIAIKDKVFSFLLFFIPHLNLEFGIIKY